MFDYNIPRWIATSVNKHFYDRKQDLNLYFNSPTQNDENWAELRFTGPDVDEYTKDCFKCNCIINILLTSFIGNDDYYIYRMTGIIVKAFTPICVYRYGNGPDDDQSLVGTLYLEPGILGKVFVHHFGKVEAESKFKKSFVEAAYLMYI